MIRILLRYKRNQAMSAGYRANWIAQVCSVASSSTSIIFSFVGLAMMAAIHPSKLKFRHQLIFFLIIYDLLKAVMMVAYCAHGIDDPVHSPKWSDSSVNTMGWFTGLAVEASDLIILCFAIHLFLVVFKSKLPIWLQFKSKGSDKSQEGGLYQIRNWVFLSIFLIAVIITSCGFARGFYHSIYWAFFQPLSPLWAFTWIFRYVIVAIIFSIYIAIYLYVLLEYKKMAKKMNVSKNQHDNQMFRSTFGDSIWYKLGQWILMLVFPDVGISAKLHGHGLNTEEDIRNIEKLKRDSYISSSISTMRRSTSTTIPPPALIASDYNTNDVLLDSNTNINRKTHTEMTTQRIQDLINEESMLKFEHRRVQILNQMKLVFIYPLSYCFIWLFPFIGQIIFWDKGEKALKLWVKAPSAFFQGFSSVIDVTVFLIREKPWRLIHPVQGYDTKQDKGNWRRYLSFIPLFKQYRNESLSLSEEPTRSSSDKRDTLTSNDSIVQYNENKRYSIDDDNIDDEDDDDKEEDLLEFLSRGPPDHSKIKNSKAKNSHSNYSPSTHQQSSNNHQFPPRRNSVNWNLNVFDSDSSLNRHENSSTHTTANSNNVTNAGGTDDSSSSEEFDLIHFLKMDPPPRS